jgi:hypothetical protein
VYDVIVQKAATKADLVSQAAALGHPVTPRLIDDWVSLGLLDQPVRHGLGRGRGSVSTWPASQVQLFERLVRARATAHRVKTLCNIPVWLWMAWGDEYVPLRQTRKALTTWAQGSSRAPWGHARAAAQAAGNALPSSVGAKARRMVVRLLTEALERGILDEVRLAQTLADAPDAEGHVRVLRARFAALRTIASIDHDTYLEARASYRALKPPTRPGDPDLQERVTSACLDLLTLIGFELRRSPGPPG